MDFQKVVLIVAIVVLIITLAMIGSSLSKERKNAVYPPVLADCPDYWENTGVPGTCDKGLYNKGNGSSECKSFPVDFSGFNDCDKYTWADKCKVTWDGISNNPDICDNSS